MTSPDRKAPRSRLFSRRDLLFQAGGGISGVALACILDQARLLGAPPPESAGCNSTSDAGDSPYLPKPTHLQPKAKALISMFMVGGVSHVDTFDYKPALEKYHGQPMDSKGKVIVRQGYPGPLMKSPYKFKQYGQSGKWVSELFPHVGSVVDELAFIHSGVGRSNDHTIAHFEWNTGSILMGYPSVGSWVTYGLGTENQNLPGFVVIHDPRAAPFGGPVNWGSGFLPAAYQGTVFRSAGDPILDIAPVSKYLTLEDQRARLDHLGWVNQRHAEKHPGSSELAARISSFELAYRMQGCAPEAVDISSESEETRRLYGLDNPFGQNIHAARQ